MKRLMEHWWGSGQGSLRSEDLKDVCVDIQVPCVGSSMHWRSCWQYWKFLFRDAPLRPHGCLAAYTGHRQRGLREGQKPRGQGHAEPLGLG